MHQALHIQEILFDIFGHCSPTEPHWTPLRRHSTAVLAALARTCRTFKEPALDVLWSELVDLTPLPQCVPDACQVVGRVRTVELCRALILMFVLRDIRSEGHSMKQSGLSFGVTHVAFGTYLATRIPMDGSITTPS